MVDGLVAEAHGVPVVAQLAEAVGLLQQLEVADVVRGPGIRNGGTGALGLDAENTVFQATTVAVPDQRNFTLRVFGQLIAVIPGRPPGGGIRGIKLQPGVPFLVVEVARFAVEKIPRGFVSNRSEEHTSE